LWELIGEQILAITTWEAFWGKPGSATGGEFEDRHLMHDHPATPEKSLFGSCKATNEIGPRSDI
jgi:hypothetical protein